MTLDIEMKKEMETALKGQQFNNLIHRHIAEEYFELGWLDAKRSTMGAEPVARVCRSSTNNVLWELRETDQPPDGTSLYTAPASTDAKDAIALYEKALVLSWPDGAKGEAFEYWNQARIAAKEPICKK